jgi:glycosyltransferase involved in cell wall biosynthesis
MIGDAEFSERIQQRMVNRSDLGGDVTARCIEYEISPDALALRHSFRRARGIPVGATLLCYIGRVAKDRGIKVLAAAWKELSRKFRALDLLICGGCDPTDPVPAAVLASLRSDPRVHLTDWVTANEMPSVYAAADICVLPTFREGLWQVALESSAMQVPLVGTRIPGLVNAIQDELTGLLVSPGDPQALSQAIDHLVEDRALRDRLGKAGREFVSARFSEARGNNLDLNEYRNLLGRARLGQPAQPAMIG